MISKGGLSEAARPPLEPSFLAVDNMVRLFYILLLGGRPAPTISLETQREIVDVLHASAAAPAMVDGERWAARMPPLTRQKTSRPFESFRLYQPKGHGYALDIVRISLDFCRDDGSKVGDLCFV